jgi:hypothetical protein
LVGAIVFLSCISSLGELTAALLLFFPPNTVLLDLVQEPILVGKQVGNAGILLQFAPPFWVLLGEFSLLPLLRCRGLLDLVAQADRRPLGFGFFIVFR